MSEPVYDQSDADNYYLAVENRALRAQLASLTADLAQARQAHAIVVDEAAKLFDQLQLALQARDAAPHRCSGCGHRWEGFDPASGRTTDTAVELCGDCWRDAEHMRSLLRSTEKGFRAGETHGTRTALLEAAEKLDVFGGDAYTVEMVRRWLRSRAGEVK